ncbi:protein of unknown function [Magnetospira sp. QH-2]|nr:protein of unknown function [Magnetospira sp. QH-2]
MPGIPFLIFMDAVFAIQLVHQVGVHEDDNEEYNHRTLLGEPEADVSPTDPDAFQRRTEKDSHSIGNECPDHQKNGHQAEVRFPIRTS